MRYLITGSSGMIGSALLRRLAGQGHESVRLVRRSGSETGGARPPVRIWDPASGRIDAGVFEGVDAVVHLAGENIGAGRWTSGRKRRILESRTQGTQLLCEALAPLPRRPSVLVAASATGFYGDTGQSSVDEAGPAGEGFLAEVVRAWEAAAEPARAAGVRTVHLRVGMVLSPRGGALARLAPLFRAGLGARLGSGGQYMSWIALEDLLDVIVRVSAEPSLDGPVNAVAPEPVTNAVFTATLARVLGRPAVFRVPAFALRLLLGEMADAMLLSGARVIPKRLLESGFDFRFGRLEDALRRALQTPDDLGSSRDP